MRLRFLDRAEELKRLRAALASRSGVFCCVYGRRRTGKSRLLQETLRGLPSVYYVADEREASLHRASLASAVSHLAPGFDRVVYPDWAALLERWWSGAPSGAVLALDEFPYLAKASPDLPSVLQRLVDTGPGRSVHLVLCGSSQSMMQGVVLDASAPLFGRAREIIRVAPIAAGWIRSALKLSSWKLALEAYSVWGGMPLYWELAAEYPSTRRALRHLVLDPLGRLYDEPRRLLVEDMRETAQASSILSLVGQGCHRMSEIAGRLGKPATSLGRPLEHLRELGLIRRERPFGASARDTKRALYVLDDPFLRSWFRLVEPNRSLLEARQFDPVADQMRSGMQQLLAETWEELARAAVPHLSIAGARWSAAARWWGPGLDGRPLEVDVVAESQDRTQLLVGEVRLHCAGHDVDRLWEALGDKIARLPLSAQYREARPILFIPEKPRGPDQRIVTASAVFEALRP